jgi:ADP-L-glycero-D-manno-heptose 6-epimerase
MKKALVTGASGFVGKNLINRLVNEGFEIVSLEKIDIKTVEIESQIFSLIDKFNPLVIFHVGALANTLEKNVEYMMLYNYEFTKLLSNEANTHNIPLIYSSSAANYGVNGKYPANLYGWSKYISEDYVLSKGGVALRYFNVYGPGEEHKGNMASFAYQAFTRNLSGGRVSIFPGNPKRDFVYIDDVIQANIDAFKSYDSIAGRYYEVGSGVASTFENVMEVLGINYGYTQESSIPVGYQFYTCSDPELWLPHWKPKFDLKSGLKTYISYLKNN